MLYLQWMDEHDKPHEHQIESIEQAEYFYGLVKRGGFEPEFVEKEEPKQ
jgi:disulfide oxidoreductase YuzD